MYGPGGPPCNSIPQKSFVYKGFGGSLINL